jgi:hypothetical protein
VQQVAGESAGRVDGDDHLGQLHLGEHRPEQVFELCHRGRQVIAGVAADHEAITVQAYRALAAVQHARERRQLRLEFVAELGDALLTRVRAVYGGAVVVAHPLPAGLIQQVGLGIGVAAGAFDPHVS